MSTPLQTGAFVGSDRESFTRADAMERWQGRPLDTQNIFVSWDETVDPLTELFETRLTAIADAGRIPLLTWEPFTDGPDDAPSDIATRIVAGEYDAYLDDISQRLDRWLAADPERTLYLRFAHEANGDWYPWAPATGGDDDAYVEMWRYVYQRLDTDERVRWLWAVNHVDVGSTEAESLYPGTEYVDWVGVDGFNWGASREWSSWQSPAAVFDSMLARVAKLGSHPLCIPEYASTAETADGHDVQEKNRWLRAFFDYVRDAPVQMAVYFDIDKETDWAIFGGARGDSVITVGGESYSAYSAYAQAVEALDTF